MNISNRENIVDVLASIKEHLGIESVYSHFTDGHSLPYLAYIATGQETFSAGDNIYWNSNTYQVELYFKKKDETLENSIESEFISGGWHYDKSEDLYLDDESIFYISYQLT